jgi:hypothetical protein
VQVNKNEITFLQQILVLTFSKGPLNGVWYTKEEGYATGIWAGCFFLAAGAAAMWFAMG